MIDDVISVAVTITVVVTVVTVVAVIILSIVWLVPGRQWTTASTVAVHVAIVGGGGIAGSSRRSVAAAATATRTIIAYLPEAGFGFYDRG